MYFKCYLLVVFVMWTSSIDATQGDDDDKNSLSVTQVSPPLDMLSELDEEEQSKTQMMKLEKHIVKAAYYSAQKEMILKTKKEDKPSETNLLLVNRWHKLMNVHITRSQIYALEIGLNNQWICNKLNKARCAQLRQLNFQRRLYKIKKYIKKAATCSAKKAIMVADKRSSALYEYHMSLVNEWHQAMNLYLWKAERYAAKIRKELPWVIRRFTQARKELLSAEVVSNVFSK